MLKDIGALPRVASEGRPEDSERAEHLVMQQRVEHMLVLHTLVLHMLVLHMLVLLPDRHLG